jgi:hypothetical protein
MSAVEVEERTVPVSEQAPPGALESHVTCCRRWGKTALCGADLSRHERQDECETTCVVCADLDHLDPGLPMCPVDGQVCSRPEGGA